eukprot:jgi/Mesvir1/1447/Mv14438-RA.1
MASVLASQLRVISLARGDGTKRGPRGKPSLLYNPQQAADIDAHTIFELGLSGLGELCEMDARFSEFRNSLFSQTSAESNRELLTKEDNEEIDGNIVAFLRTVADYFLLPAAQKTLEYLVRKFKIYKFNADALIRHLLPYHETALFVKLVQITRLEKTRWEWLEGMQKGGGVMPRPLLVQRCTHDLAVLDAICEAAKGVATTKTRLPKAIGLYSVVVMETLAACTEVPDEMLRHLLPYLVDGLSDKGVSNEYISATLLIIAQLSNTTPLSQEVQASLATLLAKLATRRLATEAVMSLVLLCQTQKMQQLPKACLKRLVGCSGLADILARLGQKYEVAGLLSLLCTYLVRHCSTSEECAAVLADVISTVPLGGQLATRLASDLLRISQGEEAGSAVHEALKLMDRTYARELDMAVNALLTRGASAGGDSQASGEAPEDAAPDEGLVSFLERTFKSSLRAPLREANGSLLSSVDHPDPKVRALALSRLASMAEEEGEQGGSWSDNEEMRQFLPSALIRRLQDDNADVADAALRHPWLVDCTPTHLLFPSLERLVLGGSRRLVRRALQLLASAFAARHPSYLHQVLALSLNHALLLAKSRKTNAEALQLLSQLDHPLVAGLGDIAGLADVTEMGKGEKDKGKGKGKGKEKGDGGGDKAQVLAECARINAEVVAQLARNISQDLPTLLPLCCQLMPSLAPPGKALLSMVLLLVLVGWEAPEGADSSLGDATKLVLPLYTSELQLLMPSPASPTLWCLGGLEQVNFAASLDPSLLQQGPPAEMFRALEKSPLPVLGELHLRGLYVLMARLFGAAADDEGTKQVAVDAASQLFGLFACAPSLQPFLQHLKLILDHAPQGSTAFLASFFSAKESVVPFQVQFQALLLLHNEMASACASLEAGDLKRSAAKELSSQILANITSLLPSLMVALSAPHQSVREAAVKCVETLQQHLSHSKLLASAIKEARDTDMDDDSGDGSPLPPHLLAKLLARLDAFSASLAVGEGQLAAFLADSLGAESTLGKDETPVVLKYLVARAMHHRSPRARLCLLEALASAGHESEQAGLTQPLLRSLVRSVSEQEGAEEGAQAQPLDEDTQALLVTLIKLYTPAAFKVKGAFESVTDAQAKVSFDTFMAVLEAEPSSGAAAVLAHARVAALEMVTPGMFGALPAECQGRVVLAMLRLASQHDGFLPEGRALARDKLAELEVAPEVWNLLLSVAIESSPAADAGAPHTAEKETKKRRKGADASAQDGADHQHTSAWRRRLLARALPQRLHVAVLALEALSWKGVMGDRRAAVATLSHLLRSLLPAATEGAAGTNAMDGAARQTASAADADDNDEMDVDVAVAAAALSRKTRGAGAGPTASAGAAAEVSVAERAYAQQLVLAVLEDIAKSLAADQEAAAGSDDEGEPRGGDEAAAFDVDSVASCVQQSGNAATRNAGLSLLASLARLDPAATLRHVLGILSVISAASLTQNDRYSFRVVQATVTAVLPAWLQQPGNSVDQLLGIISGALPEMSSERRVALLAGLLRVTGASDLPRVLKQILAGSDDAEWAPGCLHRVCGLFPPSTQVEAADTLLRMQMDAVATAAAAGTEAPGKSSSRKQGKEGKKKVAEYSQGGKGAGIDVWKQLRVAVDFSVARLTSADFVAQLATEQQRVDATRGEMPRMQAACRSLLQTMLKCMRMAAVAQSGEAAVAATSTATAGDYLEHVKGTYVGAFRVVEAVDALLDPWASLQCIVSLLSAQEAGLDIHKKALKLLTAKLKSHEPDWAQQGLSADASLAEVVTATVDAAAALVQGPSAGAAGKGPSRSLQQAALGALQSAAECFQLVAVDSLLSAVTTVVIPCCLTLTASRMVAGQAVKCAATVAAVLGPRFLPALPAYVTATLDLASSALEALNASDADAGTGGAGKKKREGHGGKGPGAEEAAEAADANKEYLGAFLSALQGLLRDFGPFLNPYLPSILHLLFKMRQRNLASLTGSLAETLACLPKSVEVRLLLRPVTDSFADAVTMGEGACVALFQLLQGIVVDASRPVVTAYLQPLFDLFLSAFDLRRTGLPTPEGQEEEGDEGKGSEGRVPEATEAAAISAFVALVLKLSENSFRPLFVRLQDWATSPPSEGPGSDDTRGHIQRSLVLIHVVNALAARLRSIFVPFYRYIIDDCITMLGGIAATSGKKSKKKRKLAAAQPADAEHEWRLRAGVVAALHKCFLYDRGEVLEMALVEKLLPQLVNQMLADPPSSLVQRALDSGAADDEESAVLHACASFDTQLAECLTEMALSRANDQLSKSLNHAVLMNTRTESVRTKMLGLTTVAMLVDRLGEEYLVLLPETIPFLAELLEDPEMRVVQKCQELIKRLEELSGEDLQQYLQ